MEARKTAASRRVQDAIAMLKADHQRVHALCAQFERASGDDERKRRLAERICQELEVHAQLEEDLFYPAVRAAIGDADLMDEAQVEHESAKGLIRQIRAMSPGDALFDARVKVLGEYVDHHVKEEEGGMFPKAKKAGVDLADLARRMGERRAALESEHSMEPFDTISSMLMMPIRAAASAARAGAAAGRRAAAGAGRATASAGTGRGRKAAAGSAGGNRHGAVVAASATRASGATKRASGATRRAAGAVERADGASATKRGAAGRAAATDRRTSASSGRGAAPGARGGTPSGSGRRGGAKAASGAARRSRTTR